MNNILYRNGAAIDLEIGNNKRGFRDGILLPRTINERYLEKQNSAYI